MLGVHTPLSMEDVKKYCSGQWTGFQLIGTNDKGLISQPLTSVAGSFLSSEVSIPEETQTFIQQLAEYSQRHREIAALATPDTVIGSRKVAIPESADKYTVNKALEVSEELTSSPTGALMEAEVALVKHLLEKEDPDYNEEQVEELLKGLQIALEQANLSTTNHDAYLRQLRAILSTAHKATSDHSTADFSVMCQHLQAMCLLDKTTFKYKEVCAAETDLVSYIQKKDTDDEDPYTIQLLTNKLHTALKRAVSNPESPLAPNTHDHYLRQVRAVISDACDANFGNGLTDCITIYQSLARMTLLPLTNVMKRPPSVTEEELQEEASEEAMADSSDSDYLHEPSYKIAKLEQTSPEDDSVFLSLDPTQTLPFSIHPAGLSLEPEASIPDSLPEELGLDPEAILTLTGRPQQSLLYAYQCFEESESESDEESLNEPTFNLSSPPVDVTASIHQAVQAEASVLQSVLETLKPGALHLTPDESDEDETLEDFLIEDGALLLGDMPEEVAAELRGRLRTLSPSTEQLKVDKTRDIQTPPPSELELVHPLPVAQREALKAQWDLSFNQIFGFSCDSLPDYEKRQLDIAFYHDCHVGQRAATETELKEALTKYKSSMVEKFLPGTVHTLRQLGGSSPLFPTRNLWHQCSQKLHNLHLDQGNLDRLEHMLGFFKQALPALAESPYDNQGDLQHQLITLQCLLSHLQQRMPDIVRPFTDSIAATQYHPAQDLTVTIPQDLTHIENRLKAKIHALQTMISNDFRQDSNLQKGLIKLHMGAIATVEKELNQVKKELKGYSGWTKKLSPNYHAAKRRRVTLETLQHAFNQDLVKVRQSKPQGIICSDIIHRLHRAKKELTHTLKAAKFNKNNFKEGLETAINNNEWAIIRKQYVMEHDSEYYYFDVQNTPIGAIRLHVNPASDEYNVTFDGGEGIAPTGLQKGGRSSMSPQEKEHAVNSWIVRVKNKNGDMVMRKVRSGVPVSFPMFAEKKTGQEITTVAVTRLREIIGMMVLESPKHADQLKQALGNPNEVIDFTAMHTSLLSPDRVRFLLNDITGKLSAKAQQVVASVLDDEQKMHKFIQSAINELSSTPTAITFKDDKGSEHLVKVNYEGILFSCPINKMGQNWAYNVWSEVDVQNTVAAEKMFGGTNPTEPVRGKVEAFLRQDGVSEEHKNLITKATRLIQLILHNKLHHDNREIGVLLGGMLCVLGQFVVDGYHDFCKSGKDRTGYENQFCIHLMSMLNVLGNKDIPPIDLPVSIASRLSAQSALTTTGQLEVVLQCLAEMGLKIDQGPGRTGNVFHQVHFDDKKHAPLIGSEA